MEDRPKSPPPRFIRRVTLDPTPPDVDNNPPQLLSPFHSRSNRRTRRINNEGSDDEELDDPGFPLELCFFLFVALAGMLVAAMFFTGWFGNYFNFGDGRWQNEKDKGNDISMTVHVPIQTIYHGGIFNVSYPGSGRHVVCPHCSGSGAFTESGQSHTHRCEACKGSGIVQRRVSSIFGTLHWANQVCHACNGYGSIIDKPCPVCKGSRTINENGILSIPIQKGIKDGHVITILGRGHQSILKAKDQSELKKSSQTGDVHITIKTLPDPLFKRYHQITDSLKEGINSFQHIMDERQTQTQQKEKGEDLFVWISISLAEALTGFFHNFTHIDGKRAIVINTTKSDGTGVMVLSPYTNITFKGYGMPKFNEEQNLALSNSFSFSSIIQFLFGNLKFFDNQNYNLFGSRSSDDSSEGNDLKESEENGDLIVFFKVNFPKSITDKQKNMINLLLN